MSAQPELPIILHIDDEPDDLQAWRDAIDAKGEVRIEIRHPRDVTAHDLKAACTVLVDVKLEHWSERQNLNSLALKPPNGLALLAVLQEHAYELSKDMPRAFALYSGVVTEIARGLRPPEHIVARAHNLEWVFDKTAGDTEARVEQVSALASAVRALPNPWPGDSAETAGAALGTWLALPETATWAQAAWRSVLRCRPPMHEFAEHTHGIGVLRWMLHRVLPYPCFLLDDAHLAARLRVTLASFRAQLDAAPTLRKLLEPAEYGGQLRTFIGRRWWRAGIDTLAFDLAVEDPANIELLQQELKKGAPGLELLPTDAFVVIDADYRIKNSLARPDEVVEVIPDDWPPFADPAWALTADVEAAPDLRAIVADEES